MFTLYRDSYILIPSETEQLWDANHLDNFAVFCSDKRMICEIKEVPICTYITRSKKPDFQLKLK